MATAALQQIAVEYAASGATESPVDRQLKIIKHVKVLGFESRNVARVLGLDEQQVGAAADRTYSYAREAVQKALPLYEGASVYIDHSAFEWDEKGRRMPLIDQRSTTDLVGWLQNCAVEADGMYADLHYLEADEQSGKLCEVAERRPDKLALSHEAYFGDPRVENGRVVIHEIKQVASINVVSNPPGTTNGLFESQAKPEPKPMSVTSPLRKILESLDPKTKGRRTILRLVAEDGPFAPMGDAPISAEPGESLPDAESPPDDQLKDGAIAAILAALPDASADALKAVLAALGLPDSISEVVAGGGGKAPADVPAGESLLLACIDMLAAESIQPKASVLKAMCRLPDDAARKEFVAEMKAIAAPGQYTPAPRSGEQKPAGGKPVTESKIPDYVPGGFAKAFYARG